MTLSVLAALITIIVGIYIAQPWGDNYAYQSFSDYVTLTMLLLWALAPYIFLIRQSFLRQQCDSIVIANLIATTVVCLGGVFLLLDTAFINIDAQGGLLLLFLPLYQWFLIGVCRGIAALWRVFYATR